MHGRRILSRNQHQEMSFCIVPTNFIKQNNPTGINVYFSKYVSPSEGCLFGWKKGRRDYFIMVSVQEKIRLTRTGCFYKTTKLYVEARESLGQCTREATWPTREGAALMLQEYKDTLCLGEGEFGLFYKGSYMTDLGKVQLWCYKSIRRLHV